MPKQRETYEFPYDPATDTTMPAHIGRLHLAGGHVVRLFFTPKGLKLALTQGAIDAGDIIILKDHYNEDFKTQGLGPLTKPEEQK